VTFNRNYVYFCLRNRTQVHHYDDCERRYTDVHGRTLGKGAIRNPFAVSTKLLSVVSKDDVIVEVA
jgi:hypothetical protein